MMRNFEVWLLCVVMIIPASCSSVKKSQQVINKKYSPEELRSDFILAKKILEANHPSLYWYTPKDSVDFYFDAALKSITDSLTEVQFKNKVAWAVSKIRCGHTSVRTSENYVHAVRRAKQPVFPLSIKTWKDSMVVLNSAFKNDSVFKQGTIITSINGLSNKQILDSIFQIIGTDGYSNNFKSQLISFNFPAYYKSVFGLSKDYAIGYIDSNDVVKTATICNYDPIADTLKQKPFSKETPPTLTGRERRKLKRLRTRSLQIDSASSTAYMRVTTFSYHGLDRFFRRSFKELKQEDIQNLIIDLRENGGGEIGVAAMLERYLADRSFKIADTVAAINRNFPYGRYIKPSFIYWMAMHFLSRKGDDERYHLRYYEKHFYKPRKKFHYDKQVYFLQGGYTFSASCMLLSSLKGQPNVTLIGEETGGGNYGNSAVHLPDIILPNTGVRITLPMYRVVFNHTREKNGRGVMPDVYVEPSSLAIKESEDAKLTKAKALIEERRKKQNQ
ncbi:MAG: S41 family peptidase [Ilyomonas sp.]